MHSNSTDPIDSGLPAHNAAELTEAEVAALQPESVPASAEAEPPAPEAGAASPAADPAAAADAPPPDDGATAAASPEPAVQVPPPLFVPKLNVEDRNFDEELKAISADLAAIRQKYRDGDFDSDEAYDSAFDALKAREFDVRLARDRAELAAEQNQANADQAWSFMSNQFMAMPQNRAIGENIVLFRAWEEAMQQAVITAAHGGKNLSDWEVMNAGRDLLVNMGLLSATGSAQGNAAPVAEAQRERPPQPDRTAPLGAVPQQLGAVPTAADPGARGGAESLASLDIETLEAQMAGMSDAQRDEILKGVPGTYISEA